MFLDNDFKTIKLYRDDTNAISSYNFKNKKQRIKVKVVLELTHMEMAHIVASNKLLKIPLSNRKFNTCKIRVS